MFRTLLKQAIIEKLILTLLFFNLKGILCELLQLPPNLKMNVLCTRLPGDSCELACERGYDLIGSAIRLCDSGGSWTGTMPQCDGKLPFNTIDRKNFLLRNFTAQTDGLSFNPPYGKRWRLYMLPQYLAHLTQPLGT